MGVGHNLVEFGRTQQIISVFEPFEQSKYGGYFFSKKKLPFLNRRSCASNDEISDKTKRERMAYLVREREARGRRHPLRLQQITGRVPKTPVGQIVESGSYAVAVTEIHNG